MTQTTANSSVTSDSVAKHWNCVFRAVNNVFNSTCGLTPTLLENQPEQQEALILGIISLVGDVEWSLFLGLPKATAVAVAAKFAGFEIPFDSSDMGDAVGELTNIFAGQVKALLDECGVKANISLPSVIRADNLRMLIQRDAATKRTCFDSPLGKFWTGILSGSSAGLPA